MTQLTPHETSAITNLHSAPEPVHAQANPTHTNCEQSSKNTATTATIHAPSPGSPPRSHTSAPPSKPSPTGSATKKHDSADSNPHPPPQSPVRPTGRCPQFRSRAFVARLKHHGIIGSMGRVGACGDNAMMESFFSLLQENVLDRQRWRTRTELTSQIVNWVERTYHRRRRQGRLGRLTPIE